MRVEHTYVNVRKKKTHHWKTALKHRKINVVCCVGQCSDDKSKCKKGWCTADNRYSSSLTFQTKALRQRETFPMFLSDEGPTLETLDFTIRIGGQRRQKQPGQRE